MFDWFRVVLGLFPVFGLFHWSATILGSDRGQRGILVSFPLARLFELGGNTIWAPALLHFIVQGTVKVVVFPHGAESFALAWMTASATVPWLVFMVKVRSAQDDESQSWMAV